MSTFYNRIENYKQLQADMLQTFIKKDSDYGDSFGKTFDKYGIVSALIRMSDKLNRLDNLASNTEMKVDESIEDTLLDLANYAMLTYLEIHQFDEPNEKSGTAFANISKKLDEIQAKGANKESSETVRINGVFRPKANTDEFRLRQSAITADGAKFHWGDTDETLELEETADYQAYMNSHESLEDMVNNLYPQLIK